MVEGIKYCRNCGKQLSKTAKFCRYCGYQFETVKETKAVINACPACGRENAAGAKFCRYCGNPLNADPRLQNGHPQGARATGPEQNTQSRIRQEERQGRLRRFYSGGTGPQYRCDRFY